MKSARTIGGIIVLYCLLQGLVSTLLYDRFSQESTARASTLTNQSALAYQGILDTFRKIPHMLFTTYLNFEDLNTLVWEANLAQDKEKEQLRKLLFNTLKPIYESAFKPQGFRQLQLHLQSGERFLQLFDPLVYGDNALPLSTLKGLDSPLKFAEGYSSSTGDYHYFFPLFHKNNPVGIIEMSVPFKLFNELAKTSTNANTYDIIAPSIKIDELNKRYPQLANQASSIIEHLMAHKQGGFILDNGEILTAFSLHSATGDASGYLISFVNDPVYNMLNRHFAQDTIISALILTLALVLGLIYYRYVHLATLIKEHDGVAQSHADALKRHNTFLNSLFQTIPSPAFLKDTNGRFLKCNEAFAKLFGKPAKEIIGADTDTIMDARTSAEAKDADNYVLSIQNPFSYEHRIFIDNKPQDFIIHKNILKNNGEPIGVVGVMQDITQRKDYQLKLEKALKKNSEQQKQLALDNEIINQYALFVKFDEKGIITDASQAMVNLSGFSKEELVGKRWTSFCKESKKVIKALHHDILSLGKWKGTLRFERKDGNDYWLRSTLLSQHENHSLSSEYIVFGTDVSNEIHIKGLSYIDELTQIYNRKKFSEALEAALGIIKRYPKEESALILFDIDDFKGVNDTHGHLVGDAILQELSATVKSQLREVDTFARWGGEEFAIIAPKTSMEGALKITEKLRRAISEHHFKKIEHLTCSFGITEIKASDSLDSLVNRADKALYSSKNKGKNRIEFLA